jgi:hypothetical protein
MTCNIKDSKTHKKRLGLLFLCPYCGQGVLPSPTTWGLAMWLALGSREKQWLMSKSFPWHCVLGLSLFAPVLYPLKNLSWVVASPQGMRHVYNRPESPQPHPDQPNHSQPAVLGEGHRCLLWYATEILRVCYIVLSHTRADWDAVISFHPCRALGR